MLDVWTNSQNVRYTFAVLVDRDPVLRTKAEEDRMLTEMHFTVSSNPANWFLYCSSCQLHLMTITSNNFPISYDKCLIS